MPFRSPRRPLTLVAAVALLAAACAGEPEFRGAEVEEDRPAPELTGTNWDGEAFALADVEGKVTVVFFGYTYCPDVCPFTLAKMQGLFDRLGPQAEDLALVFATVDPDRDTVEKLAQYVPAFDERFYGVRPADLAAVEESFDLTIQYGQPKEGPGSGSYYYVDHTGTYFVLDREGELRLTYPPDVSVDEMLPDLRTLLREG